MSWSMWDSGKSGHFVGLLWPSGQSSDVLMAAFASAIKIGRVEIAQHVYDRCCKEIGRFNATDSLRRLTMFITYRYISKHNRLDLLQWLDKNNIERRIGSPMDGAVAHGRLGICQWL